MVGVGELLGRPNQFMILRLEDEKRLVARACPGRHWLPPSAVASVKPETMSRLVEIPWLLAGVKEASSHYRCETQKLSP